jgi:hypothetical protein
MGEMIGAGNERFRYIDATLSALVFFLRVDPRVVPRGLGTTPD